jgi:muramidase (phage lysozyme)
MIAFSEIGEELLAASDDGYDVIVGSTAVHPILFDDYSQHPNHLVDLGDGLKSTAAGRYQLMQRYYLPYITLLKLTDFSPVSQDKIAIQQIKECRAIPLIQAGNVDEAIARCAHIWASLPGAGYGQHENKLALLRQAYQDAGGAIS